MNDISSTTQQHRPLADILQDPDTNWAEIREGIRKQGFGSSIAATTNGGIVVALKESLRESATTNCTATTAGDDDDDVLDRTDDEKRMMEDLKLGKLGFDADGVGGARNGETTGAPKFARKVGGRNISEVAFKDSKEQNMLEGGESDKSKIESTKFGEGQRAPPGTQLPRRIPVNHGSFRGSLREVVEDEETDELANGQTVNTPGEMNRPRPSERRHSRFSSSRRMSSRSASLRVGREDSIRLSTIFNSDTRISLSSFQYDMISGSSSSIDVMDFGIDHHSNRDSFDESSKSGSDSEDSMSNLVDSSGFLTWGNGTSSSRDSKASVYDAAAADSKNDEKESTTKTECVEKEDSLEECCETWNIEDYEDPDGTTNASAFKCPGLRRKPWKISVLSKGILGGLSTNAGADEPELGVQTVDIKRILLYGRPGEQPPSGGTKMREGPVDGRPFGKNLFSGTRRGSSGSSSQAPDPKDEYDSRPAIRIGREDDVDIGELRRELCVAGNNQNTAKSNAKIGFF